jgi:hypothetical protein
MHGTLNSFACSGFALIVIHVTWNVHLDYVCRLCDASNHSEWSVRLVHWHLYIKINNDTSKTLQSGTKSCMHYHVYIFLFSLYISSFTYILSCWHLPCAQFQSGNKSCIHYHVYIIMYIFSSFRCIYHHLHIYWVIETCHVPSFKNPEELEVLVWVNIDLNFIGTVCGGVTKMQENR